MLKISLFFLAIISLAPAAMAQNTNTVTKSNRAVNRAARAYNNNANAMKEAMVEAQPANTTLRGRVYYEDTGRPVKRASLMLVKSDSGPGEFSALTDANGEFVMQKLKAGTYYAMVNAPGVVSPLAYVDFSRMRGNERDALGEAVANFEKIEVDGINELTVQIPAKRGGAVSGRIIYENGDPAIGVRVEVLRKVNGKFMPVFSNFSAILSMFSGALGSGQTDDRGVYRFAGLPGGEYVVKASESAKHTDTNERGMMGGFEAMFFGSNSLLNFYFPDATDVKQAQILNVVMGQEMSEINITIPDNSLFVLSGKVVSMKNKKPLARARVSLQRSGDNVFSLFDGFGQRLNTSVTDEEGNWNFREIPKGDYSITVEPPSPGEDYSYPTNAAMANTNMPMTARPRTPPEPKYAKKFQELKVEDKDLADVIIELGYGATISGTVSAENNKELSSQVSIAVLSTKDEVLASTVVWNSGGEDEENYNRPQKSNNNDQFKLENISAGKIKFSLSAGDGDYYIKSARAGTVDLMTDPLELKEGEVISSVKIVVASDVGTLKGKILDSKNNPAGSVTLLLVPTDAAKKRSFNFFKNARSDAEGKFEIKLPPGEYAIIFFSSAAIIEMKQADFDKWLEDTMKSADKVTIDAEKTSTVSLKKPAA